MNIEIARAIVDFGAVVLIWMVQLIVYPSFLYFSNQELKKWHVPYTQKVTFIVAPIMFAQTGIIAYQNWVELTSSNIFSAVICATLWLLTFFEAVPLHAKIDHGDHLQETCKKLIRINKKRTALWTVLFFISIYQIAAK